MKKEIQLLTEKEIFNLTKSDMVTKVTEISAIQNELNNMVTQLVEKALIPLLEKNPSIENIELDTEYQYNDEGYAPNIVMPWINDSYDSYSEELIDGRKIDSIREEIEEHLKLLEAVLNHTIYIDAKEVLKKHLVHKLDSDLNVSNTKENKFKL